MHFGGRKLVQILVRVFGLTLLNSRIEHHKLEFIIPPSNKNVKKANCVMTHRYEDLVRTHLAVMDALLSWDYEKAWSHQRHMLEYDLSSLLQSLGVASSYWAKRGMSGLFL